jgi:hypothetical protein
MTFLIRQIEKAGVQVPTYSQPLWSVPTKDLY